MFRVPVHQCLRHIIPLNPAVTPGSSRWAYGMILQRGGNGCCNHQFSTSGQFQGVLPWRPLVPRLLHRGTVSCMATGSGDPDTEKTSPVQTLAQTVKAKAGNLKTIVKVQPTMKKRPKTDFNKSYTENIYITPVRAMVEYVLETKELEGLNRYTRRSPYPEFEGITVYLRRDVERRAKEVWGSLEVMEKQKTKKIYEKQSRHTLSFSTRRALDEYQKELDAGGREKPYIFAAKIKKKSVSDVFSAGSGKVVLYAVLVNGLNFVFKGMAWIFTGSHSMFAEFIHSGADTLNQIILGIGIRQSLKAPDLIHPYGWANFRNVASLISGVGIFCLGAGLSFYHGISGLMHPEPLDSMFAALLVLSGSFVSEGGTLLVAFSALQESAKANKMTPWDFVRRGMDPTTNVVILEDSAAVLGVAIAASSLGLTAVTGNPIYDSIGSLVIGGLLGMVSAVIVHSNSVSLVGRSIPTNKKYELTQELEHDRMIRTLHDVKATEMGGMSVKFKAEVDFDGREVTRFYLEKQDLEQILAEIKNFDSVEELENFMLRHGENIVDTLGGEVDRIEKNLMKKHPEIRHVDLEQL